MSDQKSEVRKITPTAAGQFLSVQYLIIAGRTPKFTMDEDQVGLCKSP